MGSLTPMDTRREQLATAIENGNHKRARQLELEIVARTAMNPAAIQPVADVIKRLDRRLRSAVEDDPTRATISTIIKQGNKDLRNAFAVAMRNMALMVREQAIGTLDGLMDTPQKRATTDLQIDRTGAVLPASGKLPAPIVDDSLDLDDILEHASGLLAINGDRSLEDRQPAIWAVTGDPESGVNGLMRAVLSGSKPWTTRLNKTLIPVKRTTGAIMRHLRDESIEAAQAYITRTLGLKDRSRRPPARFGEPAQPNVGATGVLRRLQNLLRHETLRAYGFERDDERAILDRDVLVGYVLYSVFDDDTDPEHAARDGWKFYKDNRAGSALPWSRRIVPPYRVNCLCFTSDIFETPKGREYTADWEAVPRMRGVRVVRPRDVNRYVWDEAAGGFIKITPDMVGETVGRNDRVELTPRDVSTWAKWFGLQRPAVVEKLIGPKRFAAADGATDYAAYIDTNGRILSAKRLKGERKAARQKRIKANRRNIGFAARMTQRALEKHGRKYKLGTAEELEYLRRLERFLRQAQAV